MKTFKIAALCALITLSLAGLGAQAEDWRWSISGGGTGTDKGLEIATDTSGNSYVAGSYTGSAAFGDLNIQGTGFWDLFVGKADAAGNWLWVSHAGGSDPLSQVITAKAITLSPDGSIYVAGTFWGSAIFGSYLLASSGTDVRQDLFVAKLNPAGDWLWAVKAGGSNYEDCQGITTDSAGNVYLTGAFLGTSSFGGISLTSNGSYDAFFAKLSPAGTWLWAQRVGSDNPNSSDHGYGIALDAQNNVYVTGAFNGTVTFGTHSLISLGDGNLHDIFVSKLSSAGTWLWARRAGGFGDDWAYQIKLDSDNNIHICGMFTEAASFGANITLETVGGAFPEVFVAKMDPAANWLWARQAGGHDVISVYDLVLDGNANTYITGGFTGLAEFGPGNSLSSASSNIYVAKLNPSGTWVLSRQAGGPGVDIGYGISVDGSNYIYLTGSYKVTASFGSSISLSSAGDSDIFVARFGFSTAASDETSPALYSLGQNYPNPFNPSTTISLQIRQGSASYKLCIYDVKGRRVRTLIDGALSPGEHQVTWNGKDEDGQSVGSGVYFYRLSGGADSLTRKMILSK